MNGITINAASAERLRQRRADFPMRSVREGFGITLLDLAGENPDLVALTSDLMYPTGIDAFGRRFPDRLVNLGIAEQNTTGVAAGLGLCGKLPVVCGYAAFITLRAVEQAKLDCAYNGVKVILTGQSAGLTYGVGGPTHQTYEDVAIMRAIPGMTVIVPSDPVELDVLLRAAVEAPIASPIYLRLGRGPEYVFNDGKGAEIGKAVRLREGDDLCLIANGPLVFEALLAADALAQEGIECGVLNVHTVKPIDRGAILDMTARVRAVLVAEEHSVHGGLGAAVLEVLEEARPCPVRRIGIADAFPPIGPVFALRSALGLSAENILVQAREMLGRRSNS